MLRPLFALLASTVALVPAPSQTPSSDVSVGVFPFLIGNMDGRIGEIVSNCQTNGIDTLYVSAFRATGNQSGDLWINDSAGDWNPAWGPVRPSGAGINLPNLIAGCHAQNIRVVAVFKCFADTVQPNDLQHRQYLLDVIDYFVDAFGPTGAPIYDLDGIALDYVRYVGTSGAVAQNVTDFVADVRDVIGGLSLHAYLIANRYTFDGPNYNSIFNSYASVRGTLTSQFGQDWEQLAPLLDVLMPMTYTADGSIYNTYSGHQEYVRKAAEYARQATVLAGVPTRRVIPVVKTYTSSGETTTPQTIDASVTGALLGGGDGYQSFRYQFLVDNPSWWGPMALHAVPGCNWPRPGFSASAPKLTVTCDPSASTDSDQAGSSLLVRFDFDGDGAFDVPWTTNTAMTKLMRHPGSWQTTLQVRDVDGHVSTTRRRFTTGSPVTLFPTSVSTASGGAVNIFVDAGSAAVGHTYLVLGTLSGTAPGFEWFPGFPVPLNADAVTFLLVGDPNGALLNNGYGTLDAQGRGHAVLNWPPQVLSFLSGFTMHWSFLAQNFIGTPTCVGDSKPLQLQ